MVAATIDAPKLNRYDASTRGSEILPQTSVQLALAERMKSPASGMRTSRPR
jgi:hypothetical protein